MLPLKCDENPTKFLHIYIADMIYWDYCLKNCYSINEVNISCLFVMQKDGGHMSVQQIITGAILSLLTTVLSVYPVKALAIKYHFLDIPNERKIHTHITPRLGGLAIALGVMVGMIYLKPQDPALPSVILGGVTILIIGMLDDRYQLRPIVKLFGQFLATTFVISGGLIVEQVTLPFLGLVQLGSFSVFLTMLWIVGVTNAINLIDGLDGLASGVVTISLISILIMAITDNNTLVIILSAILIGSNIGFLFHNFHPAKIYMGDTGSMFLGYSIAVISIMGLFKNVAIFSFILPIIVLAVPIFDTLFAIVRRAGTGEGIMKPDKQHIHYQLLSAGFSHRKTVLIIWMFSAVFGVIAILYTKVALLTAMVLSIVLLLILQFFAEFVGAIHVDRAHLSKIAKGTLKKNNNK